MANSRMDGPMGRRVMIERATGKIVADAGEFFAEDWQLPPLHPDQPLLKYMDLSKFEDLVRTSTLYLRRSDKFKDPLEGTLSEEGIHGTSRSDQAFAEKIKLAQDYAEQAAYRQIAKGVHFVSCWTINDRPCERMWSEYTKSRESVLIATTAARLHGALPRYVSGGQVRYVAKESPRTEFDGLSLFFYKDESFTFEQEYRLIASFTAIDGPDAPGIQLDAEADFFRKVPVNLPLLLGGMEPHPEASPEIVDGIARLLERHLPEVNWTHRK